MKEPWKLDCIIAYNIMGLATDRVYRMAEDDMIEDKILQSRLLKERKDSCYEDKWVRSIDAYRVLCPDDPMKLDRMRHRAVDDAVMEGRILKALSD